MPYIYVEPEVIWSNDEIVIYYTYRDNDYYDRYENYFTLDYYTVGKDDYYEFDIRDFEEYEEDKSLIDNFNNLVSKGYISKNGWKYKMEDKLVIHS